MSEMEGNFNPKLEILWGGKGVFEPREDAAKPTGPVRESAAAVKRAM